MASTDAIIERLARALRARSPLRLAVPFGSTARGTHRSDSDVDVGIIPVDPALPLRGELELQARLEQACGRTVQVVRLDHGFHAAQVEGGERGSGAGQRPAVCVVALRRVERERIRGARAAAAPGSMRRACGARFPTVSRPSTSRSRPSHASFRRHPRELIQAAPAGARWRRTATRPRRDGNPQADSARCPVLCSAASASSSCCSSRSVRSSDRRGCSRRSSPRRRPAPRRSSRGSSAAARRCCSRSSTRSSARRSRWRAAWRDSRTSRTATSRGSRRHGVLARLRASAPIEVQAMTRYLADAAPWLVTDTASHTLSGWGMAVSAALLLAMSAVNLLGVQWLGEANGILTVWKVIVPVLVAVALIAVSFRGENFAEFGGWMPAGWNGVFAAVSTGGTLFAMLGFRAAIEMAGEARNPQRDIDSTLSPGGCGLVFTGASARLSYAMAANRQLPAIFLRLNRRGVPVFAVAVNFLVGLVFFAPSQTWQSIVSFISSIQVLSLAFGPPALLALRRSAPDVARPFRLLAPRLVCGAAFFTANTIVYWCGWETNRVCLGILAGLAAAFVAVKKSRAPHESLDLVGVVWLAPYVIGLGAISALGQFGGGAKSIPPGADIALLAAFSLAVLALSSFGPKARVADASTGRQ